MQACHGEQEAYVLRGSISCLYSFCSCHSPFFFTNTSVATPPANRGAHRPCCKKRAHRTIRKYAHRSGRTCCERYREKNISIPLKQWIFRGKSYRQHFLEFCHDRTKIVRMFTIASKNALFCELNCARKLEHYRQILMELHANMWRFPKVRAHGKFIILVGSKDIAHVTSYWTGTVVCHPRRTYSSLGANGSKLRVLGF